jgi:hypothetical protein
MWGDMYFFVHVHGEGSRTVRALRLIAKMAGSGHNDDRLWNV